MDMIDEALHRLARAEPPSAGIALERAVMAQIDALAVAQEARPPLGVGVGAVLAAMAIGIVTTNANPSTDTVPLRLSVFSSHAALAPATLLATGE